MTDQEARNLMERIYARCVEVGECLEWQGVLNSGGSMYVSLHGKKLNLRRFLYEQLHGEVPAGKEVSTSCQNQRCVKCLQPLTRAQKNKRLAKAGAFSTPAVRAKISAGRRRNSDLSDEAVLEIKAWTGRVADAAAKHGISEAYAYMLRRGQYRALNDNPFAGLFSGLVANDSGRRAA